MSLQHAFLIMAHKEPELLRRIVKVLESPNHHFFIHIDKKTKEFEQFQDLLSDLKNVTLVERMNVYHGGVSQIYCELLLFKSAYQSEKNFDYFHLISAQDYPLRSNEQFDRFFEENNGYSFVAFEGQEYHDKCMKYKYPYRTDVYHPNTRGLLQRAYRKLTANLQLRLGVRRPYTDVWGGWNWKSLHRSVVKYLLEYITEHPEFLARFNYTACCDEIYCATLFHPIAKRMKIIEDMPLRYVSWEPTHPIASKNRPYIMDEYDYQPIIESDSFFCRKIDLVHSSKLLDMIDEQRGNEFTINVDKQ